MKGTQTKLGGSAVQKEEKNYQQQKKEERKKKKKKWNAKGRSYCRTSSDNELLRTRRLPQVNEVKANAFEEGNSQDIFLSPVLSFT